MQVVHLLGDKLSQITKYIGILLLLYIFFSIDRFEFKKQVLSANLYIFIIVICLNIPHLFIKSSRWKLILQQQGILINLTDSFLIYLSSLYIGFITPGRIGEFVKVLYLKNEKDISISFGMTSVLVDRLLDLYLLLTLASLGLWKFNIFENFSNLFLISLIIITILPIILLYKPLVHRILKFFHKVLIPKKNKNKFEKSFYDFYHGVNQIINYRLFIYMGLTITGYFLFFIQCYLIAISMNLSISFVSLTLFMAIANLISFIPISISGLGTRDATLLFLFGLIGIRPEFAVSYSFVVFMLFFVSGGIFGAIAWWIKPIKLAID